MVRKAVKARKYRVFVLLQWIVVVIISGASVCLSQEQKKSLGELKIEGSHIEKLVLKRKNGQNEIINTPDAIIKLLVGEYSLLESHLKGGYVRLGTSNNEWIEVSEEKPAVLKVGAPLEQVLEVQRQGRGIILNYKLLGQDGGSYINSKREQPPRFTVYKGDKVFFSDKFLFGWGGTCSYSWRVPKSTFGQLRFISSMDIGDLGPNQVAETIYNWKWYYNMPGLPLWLILAAAVILIKANRNLQLLFIAIPFLVMNLFWFIFSQVIGMRSSSDAEIFNMMFSSLAVCITFLWLFAPNLSKYDSVVAILISLTSIVLIIFTGTFSYLGFTFSQDSIAALIFLIMLMFAILLSYLLAGRRCRKSYKHVRFLLWLAYWMTILCIVSMVILYFVVFTIQGFPDNALTIFFMILLEGLILAMFLYMINLPYMILVIKNSFFRDRFYACLNLEPAQLISEIDKVKSDNGRSPDSQRFENNTTD